MIALAVQHGLKLYQVNVSKWQTGRGSLQEAVQWFIDLNTKLTKATDDEQSVYQ